jgi:hypothetical protein
MAEELPTSSERFPIDRRTLLKASVATTAATLAPGVAFSETSLVVSGPTNAEAVLKVCDNTSRRLAEIERRNEIRRETKLPLLEVSKEWRRMKEQDDSQKFSEAFGPFCSEAFQGCVG